MRPDGSLPIPYLGGASSYADGVPLPFCGGWPRAVLFLVPAGLRGARWGLCSFVPPAGLLALLVARLVVLLGEVGIVCSLTGGRPAGIVCSPVCADGLTGDSAHACWGLDALRLAGRGSSWLRRVVLSSCVALSCRLTACCSLVGESPCRLVASRRSALRRPSCLRVGELKR